MSSHESRLTCVDGQGIRARITAKLRDLDSMHVVGFSRLNQHMRDRSLAIKDLRQACQTWAASRSVINGALEAASDFFDLSAEAKAEFATEDRSKPVRYGARSKDGISKARDILNLYAHPLSDWIHLWPLAPQGYREKRGNYAIEARRVALQLMDAIVKSLGLDQAYLRNKFDEGMQVMATNFYPQSSEPDLKLGLDSHSDYGFITILLQSCQGLQVKDREEGAWRTVPQFPEALHVHMGDHLEVLSNGRYKSVIHRAILNSEKKRISIASIHNLSMDEKVAPAKELVDEQNPKGYKESSLRDFLDYPSTTDSKGKRSFINDLKILGD